MFIGAVIIEENIKGLVETNTVEKIQGLENEISRLLQTIQATIENIKGDIDNKVEKLNSKYKQMMGNEEAFCKNAIESLENQHVSIHNHTKEDCPYKEENNIDILLKQMKQDVKRME